MSTNTKELAAKSVTEKCLAEPVLKTPLASIYGVLDWFQVQEALNRALSKVDCPIATAAVVSRHSDGTVNNMSFLGATFTPITNVAHNNYNRDLDANLQIGAPGYQRKTLEEFIGTDVIDGDNIVKYNVRKTRYDSYVEAHDCAVGTSRGANEVLGTLLPDHVVNELIQGGKSLNEYTTREIIDMEKISKMQRLPLSLSSKTSTGTTLRTDSQLPLTRSTPKLKSSPRTTRASTGEISSRQSQGLAIAYPPNVTPTTTSATHAGMH